MYHKSHPFNPFHAILLLRSAGLLSYATTIKPSMAQKKKKKIIIWWAKMFKILESKGLKHVTCSKILTRLGLHWQHHQTTKCRDRRFPPTARETLTLSWNEDHNKQSDDPFLNEHGKQWRRDIYFREYLFIRSSLELLSGLECWTFSTHSGSTDGPLGLHTDSD